MPGAREGWKGGPSALPELEPDKARELALAVFDTVIEPLVVLDSDLRIITASRSFYQAFQANPPDTEGRLIYEVGDRQWDIPELRRALEHRTVRLNRWGFQRG
jgi:PAS domain-containing protein